MHKVEWSLVLALGSALGAAACGSPNDYGCTGGAIVVDNQCKCPEPLVRFNYECVPDPHAYDASVGAANAGDTWTSPDAGTRGDAAIAGGLDAGSIERDAALGPLERDATAPTTVPVGDSSTSVTPESEGGVLAAQDAGAAAPTTPPVTTPPPPPACVPVAEDCDGKDDDCDGVIDDGVKNACGNCDPLCNLRVTGLSAQQNQTCAVLSDGTVTCWGGDLGSASPATIAGLTNVAEVAVGGSHACARLTTNDVKCWGANGRGQLGDGTLVSHSSPELVAGLRPMTGVRKVAAGTVHSCAMQDTGEVFCWGNPAGFARTGQASSDALRATPVAGLTGGPTLEDLQAGGSVTCVKGRDGLSKLVCQGADGTGQIAGSIAIKGDDFAQLTVGEVRSCSVTMSGTARCWGDGKGGALGNGLTAQASTPVPVMFLSTITQVVAGGDATCARVSDGQIYCWGSNEFGQVGTGPQTADPALIPTPVAGVAGARLLAAGSHHACAVESGGGVKCWGDNRYGQLGNGDLSVQSSVAPVKVIGLP